MPRQYDRMARGQTPTGVWASFQWNSVELFLPQPYSSVYVPTVQEFLQVPQANGESLRKVN